MLRRPLLLLVAVGVALAVAPAAAADLADEQALADRFAPAVRLVEQEEECGPGEPYDPLDVDLLLDNEPTVALRGPWTAHRPREDRAARAGPAEPLRVPPRLPGRCARTRLHLRALVAPPRRRERADGVRARRDRSRRSRTARTPVLVLLRLQRLQQHARGRLGDDSTPLRRGRRGRGARAGAGRRRLQLARRRRAGGLGRREARRRRRDAPGRLSRRGLAREQVHRGPLPR